MVLYPNQIATREKLILTGLYFSKYDSVGLKKLGFGNFTEAFNAIGFALGAKPSTIKNYRDEFDPLFPNMRQGWHKRPIRHYCRRVFEEYKELDLEIFSGLIRSFVGYDENVWSEMETKDVTQKKESTFAKRLITGLAAEKYFQAVHPNIPEFKGYAIEDTTQLGCGYDFKLQTSSQADFLAVEVKGLRDRKGGLYLTPKEYEIATALTDRFFLFVVKNFKESPFHEIYPNPIGGGLRFTRKERVTVNISWMTSV
jgi:hypothetical protein